ncbi:MULTISPECIES: hypothetical protein [unclassified Streptomyces]|uniref:hypothetical protein n=1 Tax=unclassified Streptomyces TaxID=2593676 RepID=UPI00168B5BA8|nr:MULTISPECIES: hypothetical protein [unclassified Streptomyces]MBD3003264.1 hypothetical protein [Streptomyces sp. 5-10]
MVDAWFDTVTAAPGGELAAAVAMALCAELPLAAVCTALALGREQRPTAVATTARLTTDPVTTARLTADPVTTDRLIPGTRPTTE